MEAFTDVTFFVTVGPFDSKVNTCKYLKLPIKGDGKGKRREGERREKGKEGEGLTGEGTGGEGKNIREGKKKGGNISIFQ